MATFEYTDSAFEINKISIFAEAVLGALISVFELGVYLVGLEQNIHYICAHCDCRYRIDTSRGVLENLL